MLIRVGVVPTLQIGNIVIKYLFGTPECFLRGEIIEIDPMVRLDCGSCVFELSASDIAFFKTHYRDQHLATLAGIVVQGYQDRVPDRMDVALVDDDFLDIFQELDQIG